MKVLIAEDDPVNSRIIEKRLQRAGHEPYLTVNGEECASRYGANAGLYDVILMDMQVSIDDKLGDAKLLTWFRCQSWME